MTTDQGSPAPDRLRGLLSWQINKVNIAGARIIRARMPPTGRSDFALLATLEESGPLSQAELGRRLGLDRNSINGIATRLEADGHIARERDAVDRRRNTVAITSAGRVYLEQLQAATDSAQSELGAALSQSEKEQLQTLLDKILRSHPVSPA